MLSYIEKLRKAPLSQRRRVSTLVTLIIVGMIGFVWMISLTFSFLNPFDSDDSKNPVISPQQSGIEAPY